MANQRQLELDFQLPAEEAARRRRIKTIRHHFLSLIENLPDGVGGLSHRRLLAVKGTLKRLLKDRVTRWDGCGTFRIKWVAADWIIDERTLYRHISWARDAELVVTSVSTDAKAIPQTTIEFNWHAIARFVGRPVLPDQTDTAPDQTDRAPDQTDRKPDDSGYRLPETPASAPSASWTAVVAELLRLCPELSLACLEGAKAAGCLPTEVLAIATDWQSQEGAWGAGALYRRIQRSAPGLAADEGWPPRQQSRTQPASAPTEEEQTRRIRFEVLKSYRARPGATIEEVGVERERLVAEALGHAGLQVPVDV